MSVRGASTQALQQEYLAAKRRKERSQRLKSIIASRGLLRFGMVALGLLVVVGISYLAGTASSAPRSSGSARGASDAAPQAAAGRFYLHVVAGIDLGVQDHGEAWSKHLRERYKVYVVRRAPDQMHEGDWQGYYRAYNAAMVEGIREKHGSIALEPLPADGGR